VGQKAQLAKIVQVAHLVLSDNEVPPDSTGLSLCPLLYPLFTGQKLGACTSLSEMAQDLSYVSNMYIYIYVYIYYIMKKSGLSYIIVYIYSILLLP
jgi:hypothetical protein